MKILLTGLLPTSVRDLSARLIREGHQVSVMGHLQHPERLKGLDVTIHENLLGQKDITPFMDAARFEAVVFFFAFQCEDPHEYGSAQGALLDDLFAIQAAALKNRVERFVLVTDRRVFGREQACLENEVPYPDTPTGVLIKAAEDCLRCCAQNEQTFLLLRVTSLYANEDTESFFAYAKECAKHRQVLQVQHAPEAQCDFLHADDLGMFLSLALAARAYGTLHLTYGVPRTYREVVEQLKTRLPGLEVAFSRHGSACATLQTARSKAIDWVPRHDVMQEMDALLASLGEEKPKHWIARVRDQLHRSLGKGLPWIELALLGLAAWALSHVAQDNATIRFVDFWLLYVTVMGASHGGVIGLFGALVALGAYVLDWAQAGKELYLLLYNIDNWLAPVSYLLAGSMFGYLHDHQEEKLEEMEREKEGHDAEARFIKEMYNQAYEDRNRLLEQVMSYRDSYGRIYQITRELDTMQPEQVFLSTLNVVEDTLQNQSVAIYARKNNSPFARLVVHSRSLKNLPRSLDIEKLPKLREKLDAGLLFANTALEPGYPAYAAPIQDDREALAAIMLWDVPFDKQTLYFENLLNVVAGLAQSALARALRYFNVSGDMYLENTHILNDRAFRSALGVYQSIRRGRTGSFLLLRVQADQALSAEEYDRRISRAIRSTDIAGCLNEHDYYVLFPQANTENLPQISARFAQEDLRCEVTSQEAAYA